MANKCKFAAEFQLQCQTLGARQVLLQPREALTFQQVAVASKMGDQTVINSKLLPSSSSSSSSGHHCQLATKVPVVMLGIPTDWPEMQLNGNYHYH